MEAAFCSELDVTKEGAVPDWVHLLPVGPDVRGADGRAWVLPDTAAVIARSMTGVDLPIDYEHQNDDKAERVGNGPVPAAGWVKELAAREDGVWGRVEWTARARDLILAKEYRYLSPVFTFDKATQSIHAIKGAGLVHNPNLRLVALASVQGDEGQNGLDRPSRSLPDGAAEKALLMAFAEAVGLPAEATEEEVLQAVRDLKDPAKYMPAEPVKALLRERAEGLATLAEERAQAKVDDAIERAFISPGMRDWALGLCRSDPASFDRFVASTPNMFAGIRKLQISDERVLAQNAGGAGRETDRATAEIAANLGISTDKLR